MKIIPLKKVNILDFEKEHGLELVVKQGKNTWSAWFENLRFKKCGFMSGKYHWRHHTAISETQGGAIKDLCQEIGLELAYIGEEIRGQEFDFEPENAFTVPALLLSEEDEIKILTKGYTNQS